MVGVRGVPPWEGQLRGTDVFAAARAGCFGSDLHSVALGLGSWVSWEPLLQTRPWDAFLQRLLSAWCVMQSEPDVGRRKALHGPRMNPDQRRQPYWEGVLGCPSGPSLPRRSWA